MKILYLPFGIVFAFFRRSYIVFKNIYYNKKYNFDKSVKIGYEVLIYGNVEIGKETYLQRGCSIVGGEKDKVKIGEYCSIANNVNIRAMTHNIGEKEDKKRKGSSITIGDYVWIGSNSFIKEGISIGDNVVIGANSVVTKDIPSNSVFAGVPARMIK